MKNEIKSQLDNLEIKYKSIIHPAVFTCDEADKLNADIKGMHAKSLLVKTKKSKNFYMIILPCNERVDRNKIKELLKEHISFAYPEELWELLELKPGSVSPLSIIKDKKNKITLIFNKKVYNSEILNFHPGINTETLEIKNEEFKKFLKTLKNKILIFE